MVDVELFARARQQHKAGELEAAERTYRKILETEPDQPDALHLLGVIAHQCGRNEEAVGLLGQATQARSGFTQALNNLGAALTALGRRDEARAAYHEALTLDPNFADAHFNLGMSYRDSEEFDKAISAFGQALKLDPKLADAEVSLGISLMKQDASDDAVAAFRRAIEIDPGHAPAHLNLALALQEIGSDDEAIEVLKKTTELAPDQAAVFTLLGQIQWRQGRKDEAVEALERATELKPDSPAAHYDLTRALFEMNDTRAPDARLNLGIAFLRAGETEPALEAFEANLALDGNLRTREIAMKAITLKQGDRHQEMEMLLGYDHFLRAALIDCPIEYDTVEAFNDALTTHVREHSGELSGTGGPMDVLQELAASGLAAFKSSLPAESTHPFVADMPTATKTLLRAVTLSPAAERAPVYSPDAWLSGVYFVGLAGNPAPEEGPEIEFGCPDPLFKEWMRIRGLRSAPGKILLFPGFWFYQLPTPDLEGETLAIRLEVVPAPGSLP